MKTTISRAGKAAIWHCLAAMVLAVTVQSTVFAEEWAKQLAVGDAFLPVQATDQSGKAWNNQDLSGKHGFLFLFNRSVVW